MDVKKFTEEITPIKNPELEQQVQLRLDDLTKPPGSLGRLEDLCIRYCLCRKNSAAEIHRSAMYTFAADHGITEEKITPFPQEVTVQMVENMLRGGAAISALCGKAGITTTIVDIGTAGEIDRRSAEKRKDKSLPPIGCIVDKVAEGTQNFLKGPAMTEDECEEAMEIGYTLARKDNVDLFGIGEMGIGNTASSAAVYALLLDLDAETTTGVGTGSSGELLTHKIDVVRRALSYHRKQWNGDPIDALRRVGGFEIAGMTGFIFGAAAKGRPVVVDGFISSAAAFVAVKSHPAVQDYCIFSHASSEKFHKQFLETMGITPLLDLGMRLGEGTGAVLAMQIVEQALNCYHSMASFSQAGVANKEK